MKAINIWVVNRCDGTTTFGLYHNAKRRVYCSAQTLRKFQLLTKTEHFLPFNSTKHSGSTFVGDPLPEKWQAWIDTLTPRDRQRYFGTATEQVTAAP